MFSEIQRESHLAFTQAIKSLESYNCHISYVPGAILKGIRHAILSERSLDPKIAASIISNRMPILGNSKEILKKLGFEETKNPTEETRARFDETFSSNDGLYKRSLGDEKK